MSRYTKYHSNYILRKKHQNTSKGTIYERDWVTTGSQYNFGSGKTPYYTDGNFVFTTSNVISNPKHHKLSSTSATYHYDDVKDVKDDSNRIKIVEKSNDIRDYVYYGSCTDLVVTSVENIVNEFPGSIFVTEEKLTIPPMTANGKFIELNEYIINNQFDINLYEEDVTLDDNDNALRWITYSIKDYLINGEKITSYDIKTYFDEKCAANNQWDYRYANKYDKVNIIEITINGKYLIKGYKVENDLVFTYSNSSGLLIRPNDAVIEEYFSNLDGFEKLLLNRKSKPLYSNDLITPIEGKMAYYYVNKTYTWPTNDYSIDISSPRYEEFIDRLYDMAQLFDELWTDNLYRNMTHEAIRNFDWTYTREYADGDEEDNIQGGERMKKILHFCGRVFDDIKKYADGIKLCNRTSYDGNSNMPSSEISEKLSVSGWDAASIVPSLDKADTISITEDFLKKNGYKWFGSLNCTSSKMSDVDLNFMKKLLLSSKELFKCKGTVNSLRMLMGLFGFSERNGDFTIKELYYKVIPLLKETSKIEEYNNKRDITGNYDENESYWGIAVKDYVFSDGKTYVIPYIDKEKELDKKNFYYQSKGGWGKYIDNTTVIDNNYQDDGINYCETTSYLRMCQNVGELKNISQNDITEGDICYVFDINDYTEVTGETPTVAVTHYFIARKTDFMYVWDNVNQNSNEAIRKKVDYVKNIVTSLVGNNPHCGFGKYDLGKSFIDSITHPFTNIEQNPLTGLSDDEVNDTNANFTYSIVNDSDKTKVFADTYVYKDNADGSATITKSMDKETKEKYYINSKLVMLTNTVRGDEKGLYKTYFREKILPYLMQVIPSTTILILRNF